MRAAPAHAVFAVLTLLLAGCAGTPDAPAGTSTTGTGTADAAGSGNGTAPAPVLPPPAFEFTDCKQLHTFIPYPAAAFSALGLTLPEGFQLATADPLGATVDVFVAWWFCSSSLVNQTGAAPRPSSSADALLVGLPVVPAPGLPAPPGPADLELLPIVLAPEDANAAGLLLRFNGTDFFTEAASSITLDRESRGPVALFQGTATLSFGTFGVEAAAPEQPGGNPESDYRLWLSADGAASGYVWLENRPGATIGMGHATLRFSGDPNAGAPPLVAGDAHLVEGVDTVLSVRNLDGTRAQPNPPA